MNYNIGSNMMYMKKQKIRVRKLLSVLWAISQKYKDSQIVYGAPLAPRAFEEEDLTEILKDIPTC